MYANVEFYNTPEGEVYYQEAGKPAKILTEGDRDIINYMLSTISERYPKSHQRLLEIFSKSSKNRLHYEYQVVHRFVRCNFGEYDSLSCDINHLGVFQFEQVKCPLRGECIHEGVICCPELNTTLSEREKEVYRLIALEMSPEDIANELCISPLTVKRHRENIKAKIGVNSIAGMISYWHNNNMK